MGTLDGTPAMLAHASVMACGPFDLVALENLLDDHNVPRGAVSCQPTSPAVFALLAEVAPLVAELLGTSGKPAATEAVQSLLARLSARSDWPWLSRAWLQQLIWHGSDRLANIGVQNSYWQAMSEALVERIVTDPRGDVPSDLRDIIYRTAVFVGTKLHLGGVITLDDLARVIRPLIQPISSFLRIVGTILAADGERLIPDLIQTAGCRAFTECLSRALAVDLGPGDQITPELIASLRALLEDLRSLG
jgi:hypothetical protein